MTSILVENNIEFYPIKDFPNHYVSKCGKIYSINGKCIMKPSICRNYFSIGLSKNSKRHSFLVHRLVAKTFIPNTNNLPEINHKDGNGQNNNVENLEWCSSRQNRKHAVYNNLLKKSEEWGTQSHTCKNGNKTYRARIRFFDKEYKGKSRKTLKEAQDDYMSIRDDLYSRISHL